MREMKREREKGRQGKIGTERKWCRNRYRHTQIHISASAQLV